MKKALLIIISAALIAGCTATVDNSELYAKIARDICIDRFDEHQKSAYKQDMVKPRVTRMKVFCGGMFGNSAVISMDEWESRAAVYADN